ncbi:Uncharacterized protein APZ42_000555 [Daphnia magna]|uniref:Uncharacterized protein n=1 Tax=Daphnia magna TaxID=35525 RepID=A0A164JJL0_9CRUS|nr:Uncharacterized protein APZ42_000555 [Daphnia magna]
MPKRSKEKKKIRRKRGKLEDQFLLAEGGKECNRPQQLLPATAAPPSKKVVTNATFPADNS